MKWRIAIHPAACVTLLAVGLCHGAAQGSAPQRWPAEAVVRFNATSTLHDFGGAVAARPFVLTVSSNGWSAEAEVPAGQMNTASEGRDRNMHKMLNTNSHPYLRGSVTNAPIPGVNGTNITLHLNISGKPVALPVQVTGWTESAGRIQFHAVWSVSLKQYGLKPPSVMGVIRVGDAVSLEADVTVDKTKSAPEPSVIKQ